MNKYDKFYTFRDASYADVNQLVGFIQNNWQSKHIFATDRDFFLYEHGNGKKINFIICENLVDNTIVGMHGYIPYSYKRKVVMYA